MKGKPHNKGFAPSAKLSWDIDDYLPSMAALNRAGHTAADVRKEYSRLRGIAMKRLQRIGKSEFSDSKTYQYNIKGFPVLKEIRDKDVAAALADVARFVNAKTGSLTGLRVQQEKTLASLAEHGYTGINKGNIREFGEFMEAHRAEMQNNLLDSKRVYEVYMFGKTHEIKTDVLMANFHEWYKYSQILDTIDVNFTDTTDSARMLDEFEEAISKM